MLIKGMTFLKHAAMLYRVSSDNVAGQCAAYLEG